MRELVIIRGWREGQWEAAGRRYAGDISSVIDRQAVITAVDMERNKLESRNRYAIIRDAISPSR